ALPVGGAALHAAVARGDAVGARRAVVAGLHGVRAAQHRRAARVEQAVEVLAVGAAVAVVVELVAAAPEFAARGSDLSGARGVPLVARGAALRAGVAGADARGVRGAGVAGAGLAGAALHH